MFNLEKLNEVYFAIEDINGISEPVKTTGSELNTKLMSSLDLNDIKVTEDNKIIILNISQVGNEENIAAMYRNYYISEDYDLLADILQEIRDIRVLELQKKLTKYLKK